MKMNFLPEQAQHINNFLSVSASYLGIDATTDSPDRCPSARLLDGSRNAAEGHNDDVGRLASNRTTPDHNPFYN